MPVLAPPESPPNALVNDTSTAEPIQQAPSAPTRAAMDTAEARWDRPAPARHDGATAMGLILVALGIVVLFGTWFPGGGAWLFLGLGAAFLAARVLTTRRGYAVPAGLLLGFGSYVWLTETRLLDPAASGGMFFIFLGLGFLAVYAIAARPQAVWPVLPALVLIGFGAFVQATTFAYPYGQLWWLAQFWPVSLVAVGVWLLVRNQLPPALRAPVAIVGAAAIILVGVLVAAAGMANVMPYTRGPMPMPWPMFQAPAPIGNPPIQDTVTLSAPTASIDSLRLANTSGRTLVRSTTGSEIAVQATRHYWDANQAPDVQLVPGNGVLQIQTSVVPGTYLDYVVDVPTSLGADIQSASGAVDLSGLNGPVRIETASGSIDARDLGGAATIATSSGGIRITNVAGDLRVSSVSGAIRAAGLKRIVDAHSMSGAIDLTGDFSTDAQVSSVSGSVLLRFTPASSVRVDATSMSGDVNASGLALAAQNRGPHALSGTLANGGAVVSVRTTSGSIRLVGGG